LTIFVNAFYIYTSNDMLIYEFHVRKVVAVNPYHEIFVTVDGPPARGGTWSAVIYHLITTFIYTVSKKVIP